MLTSIVDESKAIEVLNEGLINTFIRKQSPNIMRQLSQALFQAQNRYFSQLSQIVQQVISFSPEDSALGDPAFIELFRRICQQFNIVEYYLTEFRVFLSFWTLMAIITDYSPEIGISLIFIVRLRKQICFQKNPVGAPLGKADSLLPQ